MIIKIAWRNLFRNPVRTGITVIIIMLAVIGSVFYQGIMDGMLNNMIDNFVSAGTGDIQIFKDDFILKKSPKDNFDKTKVKCNVDGIKGIAARISGNGIVNTGEKSRGIKYYGVEINNEKNVSGFHKWIVDGRYIKNVGEIVIGKEIASKLNIDLGDEIIVQAPKVTNDLGAISLKVVGFIGAPVADINKYAVVFDISDARQLTGIPEGNVTQIVIRAEDSRNISSVEKTLEKVNDKFHVTTWMQLLPMVYQYSKMSNQFNGIIYFIIFIASFFAILNTLLMGIFEKRKEYGVLLSVGMSAGKIIKMVLYESIFLGIIGLFFGIIFAYILVWSYSKVGIDLSYFATGLSSLGMSTILYPTMSISGFYYSVVSVIITTVITAIYPAYRTLKLEPVEALRD